MTEITSKPKDVFAGLLPVGLKPSPQNDPLFRRLFHQFFCEPNPGDKVTFSPVRGELLPKREYKRSADLENEMF